MGIRNYLIEGVSGSGKTSVCDALLRRGYQAIHGDRALAYQGDPITGAPVAGQGHANHIWDVDKVRALAKAQDHDMTFFCGGSRNFAQFIGLFDAVFVLTVDRETLERRLDLRPADEWGGRPEERALVLRLHATEEDLPQPAIRIDAAAPLSQVVDAILLHCR